MGRATASPRMARRMERLSGSPCHIPPVKLGLEEAQEIPRSLRNKKREREDDVKTTGLTAVGSLMKYRKSLIPCYILYHTLNAPPES